ncbi:MAG: tetratricopeptide repeat protein [Desulfobacterales bacterium]|nr:tetratricopeptide repeat protein [Desulfobacterales bacterium]
MYEFYYNQAMEYYKKAVDNGDEKAKNRIKLLESKRQVDDAFYKSALEVKNQIKSIEYYNNGIKYAEQGLYTQAINAYSEAIRINPNYKDAINNRGAVYFNNLHEKEKACADFRKACDLGNNLGCDNFIKVGCD